MKLIAILGLLPLFFANTEGAVAASPRAAELALRSDATPASVAQSPPRGTPTAQQSLCTQYAYASVNGYDLLNNLWGKDAAQSGSHYVYAGRQYDRPLLSNIKSLPTTVKWSYNKGNNEIRANVAYDLFTHPDKNHVNSNGEYELMIWLNIYGGVWPITESSTGSPIETVTIGGHSWNLYFGYNGQMKAFTGTDAYFYVEQFKAEFSDLQSIGVASEVRLTRADDFLDLGERQAAGQFG
ncbi:unnamed protein product [Parascedosporium putredinis]|uniref:Uncharacterized protein n=1 Tax=Parascedosporium putredinis TaxID=1442378 RepID=A0A9P1MFV0_9PEZI|nr:unnamed protein product [Parascedosporium putredinis]CAI8004211.1 unnamed protein product [Parascedosporium putredinis]